MIERNLYHDTVILPVLNALNKAFFQDPGKGIANFIAELAPIQRKFPEPKIYDRELATSLKCIKKRKILKEFLMLRK